MSRVGDPGGAEADDAARAPSQWAPCLDLPRAGPAPAAMVTAQFPGQEETELKWVKTGREPVRGWQGL